MKLIFVTSNVTYVKDNFLHLLTAVSRKDRLPEGTNLAAVVFIEVPTHYLLKNIVGLQMIGAPRFSLALLRNLISAKMNDGRLAIMKKEGIPVYRCKNINHPDAVQYMRKCSPDIIINMRTRNIYSKEVLDLPRIGCLNIHHGLLPENRGTMCDLWAWSEGRPVGYTIHWMNEKIDDGDILLRQEVGVKHVRSYLDIPYASSYSESENLLDCLHAIAGRGKFVSMKNVCDQPRYTRSPTMNQILAMRRRGLQL
ncbi:MAG: hypothetical protein HQM09_06595 [Candidatus Riflebacteria bacterium]|nr:hypothetical protein [Candidatus Riflebacteria bacterium]